MKKIEAIIIKVHHDITNKHLFIIKTLVWHKNQPPNTNSVEKINKMPQNHQAKNKIAHYLAKFVVVALLRDRKIGLSLSAAFPKWCK